MLDDHETFALAVYIYTITDLPCNVDDTAHHAHHLTTLLMVVETPIGDSAELSHGESHLYYSNYITTIAFVSAILTSKVRVMASWLVLNLLKIPSVSKA